MKRICQFILTFGILAAVPITAYADMIAGRGRAFYLDGYMTLQETVALIAGLIAVAVILSVILLKVRRRKPKK